MNITIKVPKNIRDIYAKFLAAINTLNITLNYNKGLRQLNSNSYKLLILKAVCYIFYKHINNIAKARENAFFIAYSLTNILSKRPISLNKES